MENGAMMVEDPNRWANKVRRMRRSIEDAERGVSYKPTYEELVKIAMELLNEVETY